MATIAAIEADLGGPEALAAQKRVILESVRRKLKNVLKVDEYLDDRSIIDKRRRSLIPVVREQIQLLEPIRRDLLDRVLERGPCLRVSHEPDIFRLTADEIQPRREWACSSHFSAARSVIIGGRQKRPFMTRLGKGHCFQPTTRSHHGF